MFAHMNVLREFVRTHVAPALRPHGFRKTGSHLALVLPDDDLLILEFNVHRVDPVRDVFDMTFKYALRTYWRWQSLNDPNPRRMDSASSVAFCDVMPPPGFAWAPDQPKPFSTRWAADLPVEAEALGEAFREAVDTEILPLVQRMASREQLLAEFDDPASPVLRLGPVYRDVLFRLDRDDATGIELLLAQLPDHPQTPDSPPGRGPTWPRQRSEWVSSCPS